MSERQSAYSVWPAVDTESNAPDPAAAILLPCPFCGGTLLGPVYTQSIDGVWAAVVCRRFDCGAQGPWSEHDAYAAERWNTRARLNALLDGMG
jgi:Lar family restriction alleviation protein